MAGLAPTLTKKEFKNWVKGALALLFTKDALTDFVSAEVDRHHRRLLQLVSAANVLNTCNCTINSLPQCTRSRNHSHIVPGPKQLCSRGVCNILMDEICKDHRFRGPSWKNTTPQKWCTDAFEVGKCFFPPDGYSHTTSLLETDFNGIVSVIINNLSFSSQIQANLATEPNICTKARKVGREIRHTPDHLLSDSDLRDYIDDLINLLCDPACLLNDPSAQDAVRKLRMLKTNDLTIHEKDITEALNENIRDTFSEEHRALLKKITDHFSKLQTDSVAEIDRIVAVRKTELEEHANILKHKLTDDITRHAELKKNEIEQSDEMEKKKEFEEKLKEFKEELVRFYQNNESTIPASPLVEDHAVPLTELYVQPPMSAFIKPNAFGQGHKSPEKTTVSSYRKLLFNGDNVRYKNIYVEANAGYGKTSFTKNIAMTWCQPNMKNKKTVSKFVGLDTLTGFFLPFLNKKTVSEFDDVDTLKRFDLLFLLHLRDFQDEDMCLLDDLIIKFVAESLPDPERFSKKFIKSMLRTRPCLVLCDGLDEWTHPSGKCAGKPGIPHNNYGDNCTVITTTRPWKISTIGLTPNHIDHHVEISQLDEATSEELKSNAVKILSENSGEKERDLTDFDRKVSSVKLGDIRLIPYILLQLICIWFDGLSIGKSKCETYSNTIELTLQRGLKKNAPTLPTGNAERNFTVPECMRHNALCKRYMNLLIKLGKLAFYALFQKIKESSLVIDSTTVLRFLTEQELEFCLKIGLLSQSKDSSKVSVKRYQVFFQHKSIQEFMAALYIVSEWNDGTIKSTILEDCSSLSSILEMENLFVFVCGMNPEVYTCISGELQTIVDLDEVTRRYRTYMYSYYDAERTMNSYQSMQVQCLQESVRNGHDSCAIYLHDYILTKEDLSLKIIINFNKGNVKSLQLLDPDQITAFMQSLDPGVLTSLETLRVQDCRKEPVWLADILTESARTLKCLTLSALKYPGISLSAISITALSAISITALTGLTCLQSLYLHRVLMTHSNLKCLYAYISQTTTLTQLKLVAIHCSDHDGQYRDCDVTLDLHRLNKLKMLHLSYVPYRELHVNPACLEKLVFLSWGEKMTDRASAILWQDLRKAPVLSSLTLEDMTSCQEMIQTINTLTQLQHLELVRINMGDVIPRVSPEMTHLERVKLQNVKMSSAAWQTLFLSIGQLPRSITVKLSYITMTSQEWRELLLSVGGLQHPVTVQLDNCRGPSEEEWRTIVNVLKTTPTLSLLQDLIINWLGGEASLTLKNKTE